MWDLGYQRIFLSVAVPPSAFSRSCIPRHSGCLPLCPFSSPSGRLLFLIIIYCKAGGWNRVVSSFSYFSLNIYTDLMHLYFRMELSQYFHTTFPRQLNFAFYQCKVLSMSGFPIPFPAADSLCFYLCSRSSDISLRLCQGRVLVFLLDMDGFCLK